MFCDTLCAVPRAVWWERLASLVDFATVTYGVDDDRVLRSEDFKNNAVRALPEFVQTAKFALERQKFGGIQIRGQPLKTLDDTRGNGMIELLKLLACTLENSNGIQLQSESFTNRAQLDPSLPLGNCFLLPEEPSADVVLHQEAIIGVPEQLNEFLFDCGRNQLGKFRPAHLDNSTGHAHAPLIEDTHFAKGIQTRAARMHNSGNTPL